MHLIITVINRKKNKAIVVSKALPYTCSLEDHREKHGAKKKFKEGGVKNLTEEEQIYLICDDSMGFYKEFYNGPCITERHMDFTSNLRLPYR